MTMTARKREDTKKSLTENEKRKEANCVGRDEVWHPYQIRFGCVPTGVGLPKTQTSVGIHDTKLNKITRHHMLDQSFDAIFLFAYVKSFLNTHHLQIKGSTCSFSLFRSWLRGKIVKKSVKMLQILRGSPSQCRRAAGAKIVWHLYDGGNLLQVFHAGSEWRAKPELAHPACVPSPPGLLISTSVSVHADYSVITALGQAINMDSICRSNAYCWYHIIYNDTGDTFTALQYKRIKYM